MKKSVSALLLAMCLFSLNAAPAAAYEYDKDAIKKEFKCKQDAIPAYVLADLLKAMTVSDNIFENDTLRLEVLPYIKMEYFNASSALRKTMAADSVIMVTGGGFRFVSLYVPVLPYLKVAVTNKTEQPLEIDLERSQITLGGYSGRGVQTGTNFRNAASAPQPPLIVFPNSAKTVALWRTDFNFFRGTVTEGPRWLPPFDLALNTNILGETILKVNDKYIAFVPKAVIDESKLHWQKIRK